MNKLPESASPIIHTSGIFSVIQAHIHHHREPFSGVYSAVRR
ncbi:cytochrome P450 monooxygenase [Aspergillus luchuensis]|uniref:Cytochrome P450 monooxygenase n=1 Tax=Aspergillus kawachii TaxID=1069201 RepID=A0A146FLU9_ASPKA|nr:cytochrome P450 monooxygenase [Aspergillus luchuensis]